MTTATRKCSYKPCGVRFHRLTGILGNKQSWCSEDHQIQWAIEAGRKLRQQGQRVAQSIERKQQQETKLKLKKKGEWLREAQIAFNAYIRERDKNQPCISCQRFHEGQYHAGHYRSVGSCPQLRFEPLNVHRQCSACNEHLSGNLIEYRKSLLIKLGLDTVEWLEGPHELHHYSIDQIKDIKTLYKQKLKELQHGQSKTAHQ